MTDVEETPSELTGTLTPAHIDELVLLRTNARLSAENFSVAISEQAERCRISGKALRRYITAKEADKLMSLDAEAEDLAKLLESAEDE